MELLSCDVGVIVPVLGASSMCPAIARRTVLAGAGLQYKSIEGTGYTARSVPYVW